MPLADSNAAAGFTVIEMLITIFIIGTISTGVFGLFVLGLRTSQEAERRVVGIALANERIEKLRNLPYVDVGTAGGIPAGSIAQEETIARNTVSYTVKTDIRYIDDPFDGLVTDSPPDLLNADYKQARVEVSWNSPNIVKPIVLVALIAPAGLEGGESAGTLVFQALNAAGNGVAGALVHLVNTTTTPTIDLQTSTNDEGRVILPGLPVSSNSYQLEVTQNGVTTEQTYTPTMTFIPDSDHSHLTMLQGQITNKTFVIDALSHLNVATVDEAQQTIGSIAYTLRGTKTIGTTNQGEPVYAVDTTTQTNPAGSSQHPDIHWDSYELTISGTATGYDIKETNFLLPLTLSPGTTTDLEVVLVPHVEYSLHVSVATSAGLPVDNATVHVTAAGYDQTKGTGVVGQVFFNDLPGPESYTLLVTAPGYQNHTEVVPVTGSTRSRVALTPEA